MEIVRLEQDYAVVEGKKLLFQSQYLADCVEYRNDRGRKELYDDITREENAIKKAITTLALLNMMQLGIIIALVVKG